MSKLISMTSFVKKELKNKFFSTGLISNSDCLSDIENYANFLKQQLNKGMFVPCDEDGNVLENPFACDEDSGSEKEFLQIKYNNAKEKVIFKGFWLDETYKREKKQLPFLNNGKVSIFLHSDFAIRHKLIEDLVGSDLELTEQKAKELGLLANTKKQ